MLKSRANWARSEPLMGRIGMEDDWVRPTLVGPCVSWVLSQRSHHNSLKGLMLVLMERLKLAAHEAAQIGPQWPRAHDLQQWQKVYWGQVSPGSISRSQRQCDGFGSVLLGILVDLTTNRNFISDRVQSLPSGTF